MAKTNERNGEMDSVYGGGGSESGCCWCCCASEDFDFSFSVYVGGAAGEEDAAVDGPGRDRGSCESADDDGKLGAEDDEATANEGGKSSSEGIF